MCHGPRQKRLPRPGGPVQEDALGLHEEGQRWVGSMSVPSFGHVFFKGRSSKSIEQPQGDFGELGVFVGAGMLLSFYLDH